MRRPFVSGVVRIFYSDEVGNGNVINLTLNIGKGRCQKHPEVGGSSFFCDL